MTPPEQPTANEQHYLNEVVTHYRHGRPLTPPETTILLHLYRWIHTTTRP